MSETTDGIQNQRWYDESADLSMAINLFMVFPDEIQTIVANATLIIIEEEFNIREMNFTDFEIDATKLMNLYKSQQGRRNLDQNMSVYKLLQYLYALPEANRASKLKQLQTLFSYIQEYLSFCIFVEVSPSENEVVAIVATYLEEGGVITRRFIEVLKIGKR